jgi:hypothetical protein
LKGNTVAALLGVFSDNALRILAYIGSHADSFGRGAQAGVVLHSFPNGGSPAATFVLGPLMMSEDLRRRAYWVAPQLGARANPLSWNGVSGFNSVLLKPAVSAAEAAANAYFFNSLPFIWFELIGYLSVNSPICDQICMSKANHSAQFLDKVHQTGRIARAEKLLQDRAFV